MSLRNAFLLSIGLCLVALLFSFAVGPSLPDIVPTHWNAAGQVDGRGPKSVALYLMPAMMVGMSFLMLALPKLSPKQFEIATFIDTYGAVWVVVTAMFLGIHILLLQGARNEQLDMTRWMFVILFIFFALIGNWLGKVRKNFYMGIRTPWTLASEAVWDQTHRISARVWFFGGLAGCVLALIGAPIWVGIGIMVVLSIYPIYLSWALYKKLEQ